jgi:hypothetical protein
MGNPTPLLPEGHYSPVGLGQKQREADCETIFYERPGYFDQGRAIVLRTT